MLNKLVKIANELDRKGMHKEADMVDSVLCELAKLASDETPILDSFGEKYYIDWDKNYGKSFKVVHTPEGAQSSGEWNPDLVSIVTPENTNAWSDWEELPFDDLKEWKKNWDNIQSAGLGVHKYNQIIRSMS